jgi:hypothetical protein
MEAIKSFLCLVVHFLHLGKSQLVHMDLPEITLPDLKKIIKFQLIENAGHLIESK